jgi:hypothetical protein
MQGVETQQQLNKQNRLLLGAVLVFGFGVLFYGFQQIGYSIRDPFGGNDRASNTVASSARAPVWVDTDGDGLSDQEEIDFYGTSPYLPDTDGDGISDYDEVRAGTDPLCPEGQDCSRNRVIPDAVAINQPTSTLGLIADPADAQAGGTQIGANTGTSPSAITESPDEIRAVLRDLGISDGLVASLTDAELLQLYRESAAAYTDSGADAGLDAVDNLTNVSLNTLTAADIDQLSSFELQAILVEAGFSQSLISSLSEAELRATMKEALQ